MWKCRLLDMQICSRFRCDYTTSDMIIRLVSGHCTLGPIISFVTNYTLFITSIDFVFVSTFFRLFIILGIKIVYKITNIYFRLTKLNEKAFDFETLYYFISSKFSVS